MCGSPSKPQWSRNPQNGRTERHRFSSQSEECPSIHSDPSRCGDLDKDHFRIVGAAQSTLHAPDMPGAYRSDCGAPDQSQSKPDCTCVKGSWISD